MATDENGNPDSHMFIPCPELTNEQVSQHVAREFCKAYVRQFGDPASVVEVETQNVDAIIDIDGRQVALEFLSYRQRDDCFEIERADTFFRQQLSKALVAPELPVYQMTIWWRTEGRDKNRNGFSPNRTKVPRGADVAPFSREIVQLVIHASTDPELEQTRIAFRERAASCNRHAPAGWQFVEACEFRLLAEYCKFIKLQRWEHQSSPQIITSVDVRSVALDERHLASDIDKKRRKLMRYRQGTRGKALWLVVHSDGNPLSTGLPARMRGEAVVLIHRILNGRSDSFDRVWWAENTGFLDAAQLFEVAS